MIKKLLSVSLIVLGLTLGGCTTPSLIPPAPATPAVTDVTTEQTNISNFKGNGSDYLNIGVELSNLWCTQYLNALTQNVTYTDFAATEATQLGALSTGIAAAYGAGAPTSAVMGLLFPSLNQSFLAAGRMATAGADPGVVYSLVAKEHSAFLGGLTAPQSVAEAVSDVSSYAAICQPAGIRSAVLQSGLSASVSAKATTSSTTQSTPDNTAPGAVKATMPAARVNIPPVLIIGQ